MWAETQRQSSNLKARPGFTIVELLIVIVVIGILAAITIVSYAGIQDRARTVSLKSDLANAFKQLEVAKFASGSELYPGSTVTAGLKASAGTTFDYNYEVGTNSYCLSAIISTSAYSITNTNNTPVAGSCSSNGLVGWWSLNANANDQIGASNGIVTGASLVVGQNGQNNSAYAFNGTTDYILGPAAPATTSNVTATAWGLVQSGVTKGTVVHVGASNGYSFGVGTSLTVPDNRVTVLFPGMRWISTTTTVGSGWHMFALVLDGSGVPTVYVDGNSIGTFPGVKPMASSSQISIGRNTGDEGANQAERSFNSSVDDVRIYNRIVSASEIQTLYNAGAQ